MRMDEKTFPMHDVSAIGLKCAGSVGFSFAAILGIRWITPSFHACGIKPDIQHELYKFKSAGSRDGQCFRILYEIWSKGVGEEEDLEYLITSSTSLWEMGSSLKGVVAGWGLGSQGGLVYDLGLLS